ncbi:hypothetical protein [Dyella sp. ASV21]|uniref:hypothetical protein n=1 Tax=Dyella sp. ASV21 TaxID=2795114 RepID=UPI0018EE3E26|nr:hypothetical protein [Dyella sp. ASV21]
MYKRQAEAGVDDFLAEATPEAKLKLIRKIQAENRLVAMAAAVSGLSPVIMMVLMPMRRISAKLSLIHISEPTRPVTESRVTASA